MATPRTERADRGRGAVPGLRVRTDGRGRTSYRLKFRVKGRGRREFTATFEGGLAAARAVARDYRARARLGVDPRPPKAKGSLTLTRAAALWVRGNRRRWRRSTTRFYVRVLRRRVLPELGKRDPQEITRGELRKLLDDVAARTPTDANRAHAALSALFRWLGRARQEWIGVQVDPTRGLERPAPERRRDVTYTDAELRRFLIEGPPLVRFLAYTGVRDDEARGLSWNEVDFERGVWTIPGSRTKSGEPHAVPLSEGARGILASLRETFALRPWVRTRPTKLYGTLGLRPHDLRRTVGDRVRAEYGDATMHAVLGHASLELTRTYGPTPRLRAVAGALEWWSTELERIRSAA